MDVGDVTKFSLKMTTSVSAVYDENLQPNPVCCDLNQDDLEMSSLFGLRVSKTSVK